MRKYAIIIAASIGVAACRMEESPSRSNQPIDSMKAVVDSVFPVEAEVRRFKAARNGISAAQLEGGAPSIEELVGRFIKAVEREDSAALRAMVLTAAEYIDLYYPSSIYYQPPYKQSPELNWFLLQENSAKGLNRLLRRYGGQPTGFSGYECSEEKKEGQNTLHDRCTVTWTLQPSPMRVFSTIIEREGRFKIMSYANDL